MTHWTAYFDKVFLINLPERKDRLKASIEELGMYNIPFERFEATKDENGAKGLYSTMMELFKLSLDRGYEKILVFEDDVKFLLPVKETSEIMDTAIKQIPDVWQLLYLGCNAAVPFKRRYSSNLLYCERSLATHSVAYSNWGMRSILMLKELLPYDVMISALQYSKFSYCIYPMLCSQNPGYSNIENKYVSHYNQFLEDRFKEQTKHLIP